MLPTILYLFAVGFLSGLFGCVSYSNTSGEIEELTLQVKVGVTTKDEIYSLFGNPTSKDLTTINGQPTEGWNYYVVTATTHPLLSIPIVGPLIIPSDTAVESENRRFTFYFSERGIVRGIARETEHITGDSEIALGSKTETKKIPFDLNGSDRFKQNFSQEALHKIEFYHSTKEEVQKLFGKPTTVSTVKTAEGLQELWTYFYTNMNLTAGESHGSSHEIIFNDQEVVIGLTSMDHSWIIAPLNPPEGKDIMAR